ncbi:hypothetical protein LINPERHAP1_LOCUS7296, partial [Linum perenne]
IRKILTWVRLPRLLVNYFNHVAISRIGNYIGRTVHLDLSTMKGAHARYTRVCVDVDLLKPFLDKYSIEDRTFHVVYGSLSNLCFFYELYGYK